MELKNLLNTDVEELPMSQKQKSLRYNLFLRQKKLQEKQIGHKQISSHFKSKHSQRFLYIQIIYFLTHSNYKVELTLRRSWIFLTVDLFPTPSILLIPLLLLHLVILILLVTSMAIAPNLRRLFNRHWHHLRRRILTCSILNSRLNTRILVCTCQSILLAIGMLMGKFVSFRDF